MAPISHAVYGTFGCPECPLHHIGRAVRHALMRSVCCQVARRVLKPVEAGGSYLYSERDGKQRVPGGRTAGREELCWPDGTGWDELGSGLAGDQAAKSPAPTRASSKTAADTALQLRKIVLRSPASRSAVCSYGHTGAYRTPNR